MSNRELIRVVAAEIEFEGTYLITQRRPHAIFPLLWEFPSGKVETGESDAFALKRELQERLGVDADIHDCSMFVKHEYEDYVIDFYVYQCSLKEGYQLQCLKVHDWRWVPASELENYEFPPADADTIRRLIASEND